MTHRASAYTLGSQYSQTSSPDSSNPLPFSAYSTASHQGSAYAHSDPINPPFNPPAHIVPTYDPTLGRQSQFYEALPPSGSPPSRARAVPGPAQPEPASQGLGGYAPQGYYQQPYGTSYAPMPAADFDPGDEMSEAGKGGHSTDNSSAMWMPPSSHDAFGSGQAALDDWNAPEPKRTRCSAVVVLSIVGSLLLVLAIGLGAGISISQKNKKDAAAASSSARLSSEISAASSIAEAQGFTTYSLLTITLSDAVVTLSRAAAATLASQTSSESAALTSFATQTTASATSSSAAAPASSATTISATSAISAISVISSDTPVSSTSASAVASSTADFSPSSELSSAAATVSSDAQPTTSAPPTSSQIVVASTPNPTSAASTAVSEPVQTSAATEGVAASATAVDSAAAGKPFRSALPWSCASR